MVKLTPELIQQSYQYVNPIRDRELDLRGYKIPVIENLGATLDQFDTIDFSDNDIRKLDGFPLLKRLKCLLLNSNRVIRISEGLEENLPSLETLILTGNLIQELGDIDALVSVKTLRVLSLLQNPVTNKPHYRLYVIYKLPQLTLLDFQKIKKKERDEATALFKSKKGKELAREIAKQAKTFVPGQAIPESPRFQAAPPGVVSNPEDIQAIKEAIARASSLDEIERLNQMLRTGVVPKRDGENGDGNMTEEMDES